MLRPSGVSSASDASWAASASCASVKPGAAKKADAWRLPSVIVPVLSISSTSTSPAASTARPEVAMTLACIIRLMPATPIAESSAPIVVGIRQTSSATSVVTVTAVPAFAASTLKIDIGSSVTTTTRKTIVSATSRMLSAISFGVFCRRAPSTIAIIRSRNDSPGLTADAHDEPVGEHARAAGHRGEVAARLADHRRRLARDRALVDRGDAFDDLAVERHDVAGLDQHDGAFLQLVGLLRVPRRAVLGRAQHLGDDLLLHAAQARRLRLAAAFGERLGEVGEEHREPQPDGDGEDECRRLPRPGRPAPGGRGRW